MDAQAVQAHWPLLHGATHAMSELAASVASLGVDDEDPRIATLRPDDVVAYALGRKTLLGIRGSQPRHFFAHLGFNRFAATETPVPARAEETETPSPLWLRELCFDKNKRRLRPAAPEDLPASEPLRVLDDDATPFVAYVGANAAVYRRPRDGYLDARDWTGEFAVDRLFYSEVVAEVEAPRRCWPGEGCLLIDVEDGVFVFVGGEVYAFRSEPVEAFHCSLGAGGGVYALAVTATSCVFLRDRAMAKRSDVEPHLGDAGWAGAYGVLYDRKPPRSPLRDVKLIAGRDD